MADDGGFTHTQKSQAATPEEIFQRSQETQVEYKFPKTSSGIIPLPAGSRGPISLYLKRSGNSFGFTLRHFIIYPPDSLEEDDYSRQAGITAITKPLETIFVKKVIKNGPAEQAGLQCGHRIVAVNDIQVIDKPYNFVIHLIQNSPSHLHLLVVPKEEDILQRHFQDTAHNPISNQDYHLSEPLNDRQNAQRLLAQTFQQRPGAFQVDAEFWRLIRYPFGIQSQPRYRSRGYDRNQRSADSLLSNRKPLLPNQQEIYAEIHPNDIGPPRQSCKAQPQVPLYQKMGRRSSEGNGYDGRDTYYDTPEYSSIISDDDSVFRSSKMTTVSKSSYLPDTTSQSSASMSVITYPSSAGCRLSLDGGRRESSSSLTSSYADGSKDSLSSFGSNSTLTGQDMENSAILSRYKKSFQQKEEFLRMPTNSIEPALIQREYYGRSKKLDRAVWPPNESPSRNSKPTHHNFQRVKNDINSERDFVHQTRNQMAGGRADMPQQKGVKSPKEKLHFTNLDYIREASTPPTDLQNIDAISGTKTAEEAEDMRVYSPTQLVHARARQFESGKAVPEDDPVLSDRTSFHRSDLARLSSKHLVPNVSERAHEYETKIVEPRRDPSSTSTNSGSSVMKIIQRDSRSLDSSDVSGTQAKHMRARSNSAESWLGSQQAMSKSGESHIEDEGDEDRVTRRESYLKATEGSRMHFEYNLSDGDVSPQVLRSGTVSGNSSSNASLDKDKESSDRITYEIIKEGSLNCKITELDGKKSGDRSWKQIWAVLRGPKLFLYKDRNHLSPNGGCDIEHSLSNGVDIRSSLVRVAEDYTKRKHVLRVSALNPCRSELLLQADNSEDLSEWVKVLNEQVASDAEPKREKYPTQLTLPSSVTSQIHPGLLSPHPSKKQISQRNRSPTGQSPVSKTRKPSQGSADIATSPKSKTWRGRVAKQFRKIHQGASSPSSPTAPEGSTFGIALEQCLPADANPYVPRFVEVCTGIVEERGLQTVGIYRVPGNNASITGLTEEINRNFDDIPLDDQRWSDVHVVSSILKSFFRKLPDSLVTNNLYPNFIKADKIENPMNRLHEFKRLINRLPPHNYHTLKHLILHLNRVVENHEVNKMEAKSVAIVFGPNIVRPEEETVLNLVNNMTHQCRIVEMLLTSSSWFFSENDDCEPYLPVTQEVCEENECYNQQTLLNSITKLETPREKNGALFSSIISAAQRKVKRKTKATSFPEGKEDMSSSNGSTRGLTTFSSSDLKDNNLDPSKVNVIPTTVTDLESNMTPAEKNLWFNYTRDVENFHKRVANFELETKANLARKHFENAGGYKTDNLNGNRNNRLSTQSCGPKYMMEHNENNLNNSNAVDNNFALQRNRHLVGRDQNRGTSYSAGQLYADTTDSVKKVTIQRGDSKGLISCGSMRESNRRNDKTVVRRGSSVENLSSSSSDLKLNGASKKAKCEHQEPLSQRTGSLESVNKPHIDDDTDLVKDLTKLYDQKLEGYTHMCLLTGGGDIPFADESPEKHKREREHNKDRETIGNSKDLYKNPSLHKNNLISCNKLKKADANFKETFDENEKDEDSSLIIETVPDNERNLPTHKLTLLSSNHANNKFNNVTNNLKFTNSNGSKLTRSESLNKPDRTVSPLNSKVKRSESLNKTANEIKVKRSDSLTKTEKTECNNNRKRELLTNRRSKELKRKNGMPDRSIKRRHTVGGTKDPDKVTWLDKYQEEVNSNKENKEKGIRTSSPDLSSTRRERLLFEINLIGPENMVVALRHHLIGGRPQSFPESTMFQMPLESHV